MLPVKSSSMVLDLLFKISMDLQFLAEILKHLNFETLKLHCSFSERAPFLVAQTL